MNHRILVTGIGGPAGRAVATALHARGIHVMGTDIIDVPAPDGVRVVQVPPATDPDAVDALRRLIAEEGITVLIPTVSDELPRISAARAWFGDNVHVAISAPGPVSLANDKLLTAWVLDAAGVPVPRFGVPGDFADAGVAMAALGAPVVVKPRISRGGRGVLVIDSPDAVDWDALPAGMIVQEFIPGTEYGPMVHGTEQGSPDTPFAVVFEKTELAQGIIGNAVAGHRVGAEDAADVGTAALAAVRALGLAGPADVDVRRRADGTPAVLEVNARFGANSAFAPELLDAVLASAATRLGASAHVLV
ncbi:ATP-grasp domain-containing protein (plasmid) [Pseudarthrobacter sp. P1]|uniref:ATP-grasp domain-containing protein n=1 Tax=Pseudarthrobacter sp. P1 TaxID=3418418 RepID=UPI003CEDA065